MQTCWFHGQHPWGTWGAREAAGPNMGHMLLAETWTVKSFFSDPELLCLLQHPWYRGREESSWGKIPDPLPCRGSAISPLNINKRQKVLFVNGIIYNFVPNEGTKNAEVPKNKSKRYARCLQRKLEGLTDRHWRDTEKWRGITCLWKEGLDCKDVNSPPKLIYKFISMSKD